MKSSFKYIIIFVFCCQYAFAQQGNVWIITDSLGLDFNYSPPKRIPTRFDENDWVASISDCSGKLLFYSNGVKVWDRNNELMPNGVSKMSYKKDPNNVHVKFWQKIIIPFPGDTSKYIIAMIGGADTIGLYYWMVDMSLNNGLGNTIGQPRFLTNYNNVIGYYSHMTFTKNDGNGFWLVVQPNDSIMLTYKVTDKGIDTNAVESKVMGASGWFRFITFSHDGNSFISTGIEEKTTADYCAFLYTFIPKTGKAYYPKPVIARGLLDMGTKNVYTSEFSPNDSLIYLGTSYNIAKNGKPYGTIDIYQCERFATKIPATVEKIFSFSHENAIGKNSYDLPLLKLGSDNKLYVFPQDGFISIINKPDLKDSLCDFKFQAIQFPTHVPPIIPTLYSPVRKLKWTANTSCQDSIYFKNYSDTSYFQKFIWHFGEETNGVEATDSIYAPWHTYRKSGKYFVRLQGINSCGGSVWYSDSIEVIIPPHPAFRIDSVWYSCGKALVKVSRTDSANDIIKMYWDWGDSSGLDSGNYATHVYDSSSRYHITLQTLSKYCAGSISDSVQIDIDSFPKAIISNRREAGCSPLAVKLKSNSENADSIRWILTLPDKGILIFDSLQITLSDTGWYQLQLVAYNEQGCSDTARLDSAFYVAAPPQPTFDWTSDTLCGMIRLAFNNLTKIPASARKSGLKYSWLWEFGDGTTDTAFAPVHDFRASDTFSVRLKLTYRFPNRSYDNSISENIEIMLPKAPTVLIKSNRSIICTGDSFLITSQAVGKDLKYQYFLNNLLIDTTLELKIKELAEGNYWLRLEVQDRYECRTMDSILLQVLPHPDPKISISDSEKVCGGMKISFKSVADSGQHFWDFGDGSSGTLPNPIHIFSKSGSYIIKHSVNNGACEEIDSIEIFITVRTPPIADFSVDKIKGCIPFFVNLKNLSTDADSFSWDFGDGNLDTITHASYTYLKPGKYPLQLTAYSREGCVIKSKEVIIEVFDSVTALIHTSNIKGCSPLSLHFSNIGYLPKYGTVNSFWDFGDGSTSTLEAPDHVFSTKKDTVFWVKLLLQTEACAVKDSVLISIHAFNPLINKTEMIGVTVTEAVKLQLYWKAMPGAAEYLIERKTASSSFSQYGTTTDTTFTDAKALVIQSYCYRITALDSCGNVAAPSLEACNMLLQVRREEQDTISELNWNPYSKFEAGIKTYSVLKKDKNSDWKTIKLLSDNYYPDAEYLQEEGSEACYRVSAMENGGNDFNSFSNEVCLPVPLQVWIPNAFSPNNDGYNDVLRIKGTGISDFYLEVYNRWGERVFVSRQLQHSWDGSNFQEGLYLVLIRAKGYQGNIYRKEKVLLLR